MYFISNASPCSNYVKLFYLLHHILQTTSQAFPLVRLLVQPGEEVEEVEVEEVEVVEGQVSKELNELNESRFCAAVLQEREYSNCE